MQLREMQVLPQAIGHVYLFPSQYCPRPMLETLHDCVGGCCRYRHIRVFSHFLVKKCTLSMKTCHIGPMGRQPRIGLSYSYMQQQWLPNIGKESKVAELGEDFEYSPS